MRKLFKTRFAMVAILSLFTFALASAGTLVPGTHRAVASGPWLPPDPWEGNLTLTSGPWLPPDPWEGDLTLTSGPWLPPDPWEGNLALTSGPWLPPDPWEGN